MPEDSEVTAQPELAEIPDMLVAEWDTPSLAELGGSKNRLYLLMGTPVAALLLVALGIWQHNLTYYIAAAVALSAWGALFSQKKTDRQQLHILLTTRMLKIGKKTFPLAQLAGFWLEKEEDLIQVNIEPNKAAALPISFLYPTDELEDARETLLTVLPEVEAREESFADNVNRLFRL